MKTGTIFQQLKSPVIIAASKSLKTIVYLRSTALSTGKKIDYIHDGKISILFTSLENELSGKQLQDEYNEASKQADTLKAWIRERIFQENWQI